MFEHSDHVLVLSEKREKGILFDQMRPTNARRPKARKTCIIAESVASSVGFEARTSSHRTSDSSTFCDRTSASDFKAYSRSETTEATGIVNEQTLTNSLLGCLLRSLLHATMADLFDPVSRASDIDLRLENVGLERTNRRLDVSDARGQLPSRFTTAERDTDDVVKFFRVLLLSMSQGSTGYLRIHRQLALSEINKSRRSVTVFLGNQRHGSRPSFSVSHLLVYTSRISMDMAGLLTRCWACSPEYWPTICMKRTHARLIHRTKHCRS
jgi:hypothetical protein